MVQLAACVTAVAAVATAAAASTAAPQANEVTLQVRWAQGMNTRVTVLQFSGVLRNRQANQYVAVLQQPCGSKQRTAIAGTTTAAGGVWRAEPTGIVEISQSATYWARWRTHLSKPVTRRGKVPIALSAMGGSRYRVTVTTSAQTMNGKAIELHREVGGSWRRAAGATLRGRSQRFTATVSAPGTGARYRVHIPARAARPCYTATTSEVFVVGQPPAPGSSTVIDRTFSCATEQRGGLHKIELTASAAMASQPFQEETFGLLTYFVPDGTLAAGSAGAIQFNPQRCTAATARPALTSTGLRGGAVTSSGEQYECEAPPRVLVRLRASFHVPTKFDLVRPFGYPMQVATATVKEAALVVLTPTGRKLAFASLGGGKARLFAAASCNEDDNG